MKRYLIPAIVILAIAACNKTTTLPSYTPPVAKNFSVASLKHTQDSVNVGDTIYLTATGTASDSSQFIYTYLTVNATAGGVSSIFNYASGSSPVKLPKNYGAQTSGLYSWTSTIMLPGATLVPHKTKLTIVGNFIYQLSLSSEQGTLSATDAGLLNKTVYVR
jgi:hypothetical protein